MSPTSAVETTGRLLAGVESGRVSFARHRALHPAPPALDLVALVDAVDAVGLVGRGGAAFPVARKLSATRAGRSTTVVVNGSEGEPASHKDRVLMRVAPHLVIDGALVVAQALGAGSVVVTVHDESSRQSLLAACRERPDADSVRVDHALAGFVAGEATAVVARLNGAAAVPDGRRVPPSSSGVSGRATFLSNAETFAQLGWILSHGEEATRSLGTTDEPGTSLATCVGDVSRPGVVEVGHGTRIDAVTGRPGAVVLLGGYHGTWTVDDGLTLERQALRSRGLTWGAGVVVVLPEHTCPLGEVARVARWLASQSAGRCGPCTFGLPAIADDLEALLRGDTAATARLRRRLGLVNGRGACAHPDGAARFTATALEVFADDVASHATGRGCGRPVLRTLPVGEELR